MHEQKLASRLTPQQLYALSQSRSSSVWKRCFMATLWTGLWYRSKGHRPDVNSPSPLWNYKCGWSENVLEVWIISHATCHLWYINDTSSDDPALPWPISLSVTGIRASTGVISFLLKPRITDGIQVRNDHGFTAAKSKKIAQRCVNVQKYHRHWASFLRS